MTEKEKIIKDIVKILTPRYSSWEECNPYELLDKEFWTGWKDKLKMSINKYIKVSLH